VENRSENILVEMELDLAPILIDLFEEDTFLIVDNESNDFVELQYNENTLQWGHYVSAFATALLAVQTTGFFSRRSVKKYIEVQGLLSIVNILSKKDNYTATHSNDVSLFSVLIGKKMGMSKRNLSLLRSAGLLHDIGKIGISDIIINKQEKLSQDEWDNIQNHSQLGYDIVSQFPGLELISEIVLDHHEKLDGSGYPNHKTEEKIHITSQILAVADIFSALTSDRTYRRKFEVSRTIDIMRDMKINQEAVDALVELNDEGKINF